MKLTIPAFLIFVLTFLNCSTEPEFMNEGIVIGFDTRECICCGGYFIEIDNDTLRFYSLPDKCILRLNTETLPVKVLLNWKKDPNACLGDEILILQIEKK